MFFLAGRLYPVILMSAVNYIAVKVEKGNHIMFV